MKMKISGALAILVLALAAAGAANGCGAGTAENRAGHESADILVAWNERVLAVAQAQDRLLTLKGVRTAAMMHIAMHDALNAIRPRYAAYAYTGAGRGADPIAAVAQAGYEIAVSQYPDKSAQWQCELDHWLSGVKPRQSKERGIELGKAAAAQILKRREGDGWDRDIAYEFRPPGPGAYEDFPEHSGTPPGFVFGVGWAQVVPLAMTHPGQFRVAPPPATDSAEYAVAYDEVKEVGSLRSRTRTADQTHLAFWWKDFAENSHNRLARQLVSANRTPLWRAARLFALLNMSILDAYVSSFDSKFTHHHWRPYTAIRRAGSDGNAATQPDADWNNTHRFTYPTPTYPSTHATACAAAMVTLADTFGERYAFTMQTREVDSAGPGSPPMPMDPPARSFDTFSSAAMECALSRVYLGIHFRHDSLAGNRLGTLVGNYAVDHHLVPQH